MGLELTAMAAREPHLQYIRARERFFGDKKVTLGLRFRGYGCFTTAVILSSTIGKKSTVHCLFKLLFNF